MWIFYFGNDIYEVWSEEGLEFGGTLNECRVYLNYFIL